MKTEPITFKTFRIQYEIKSKYHSQIMTVEVKTSDKTQAQQLVYEQYGSIKIKRFGKISMPTIPSDKIKIVSCDEIDKDGNAIPEEISVEEKVEVVPVPKTRKSRKKVVNE
jgi:hypothetical protein